MPLAHPDNPPPVGTAGLTANPLFTREPLAVPRDRLPDTGMDAELAYQLVHDELMLDGNAIRNGMTHDLAQLLLADLRTVLAGLARQREPIRDPRTEASFAHDGRPASS